MTSKRNVVMDFALISHLSLPYRLDCGEQRYKRVVGLGGTPETGELEIYPEQKRNLHFS